MNTLYLDMATTIGINTQMKASIREDNHSPLYSILVIKDTLQVHIHILYTQALKLKGIITTLLYGKPRILYRYMYMRR